MKRYVDNPFHWDELRIVVPRHRTIQQPTFAWAELRIVWRSV
jgi:hypothetical protein